MPKIILLLNSVPFTDHHIISQLLSFVKINYIQGRYYSQEGVWQLLHPKHFDNMLSIHHLEGRDGKACSNIAALMKEGLASYIQQLPPPDIESHNIADAFKPFEKCDGTTVTQR